MAKKRTRSGPTFIQRSRSESSEQKAIFHNVTGAGRRGTIREFFALGNDDETAIKAGIEKLLADRIAQTGT